MHGTAVGILARRVATDVLGRIAGRLPGLAEGSVELPLISHLDAITNLILEALAV